VTDENSPKNEAAGPVKAVRGSAEAKISAVARPTLIPAAIKGTHDILPGEVEKWQALERLARETFELYGFRELRAPVFEATELFEKGTGATSDVVTKEMYTFTDKGGRSLTLRPEYTPSVVRAIMEHRLDLRPEPMRYYFVGPMFRYDKPQKGRYRQFHQVDIEVFGEKDAAVDAEIIEMALALLGKLGVGGTETLVNSVGCRACRPVYSLALRAEALKRKADFCPDCQRKAETNPLRIFDCKVEACQAAARAFPLIQDFLCDECRDHFAKLRACLEALNVPYRVEPRLVRGLDYYTKTTFEIVSSHLGAQNSILGGGRYDDMMKDFGGPDICGTGFAMGMERVLAVAELAPAKRKPLYLAYLGAEAKMAGLELARYLRENGVECLVEYKDRGMKAHFGRANKLEAAWVLIVGEDEMKKGRFGLKEMATGRQVEGTREELLAVLRGG
jgi:histidyl-tRNA synthetase